eukprot:UN26431
MAFGLPILQKLYKQSEGKRLNELFALILTPTRELALQIVNHLQVLTSNMDCRVCPIVGGVNRDKQERIIKSKPEIIVATPGRYWSFMQEEDEFAEYLTSFDSLRCLVLDEADRLLC